MWVLTSKHSISQVKTSFLLVLVLLLFWGCGAIDTKQKAKGIKGQIVVVMDSTKWNSASAEAIRKVFGGEILTLPRPEPRYTLQFRSLERSEQVDQIKKLQSVIVAATLGEDTNTGRFVEAMLSEEVKKRVREGQNFAFPLSDRWAYDQWFLILTDTNDVSLANKILDSEEGLISSINRVERKRWQEDVFDTKRQVALEDSLRKKHGFSFGIQHDYVWTVDTTNFVSFDRPLADNSRWIWVYWFDDFYRPDLLEKDWINATRDSLMKIYVQGSRPGSYVQTEYRRTISSQNVEIKGHFAVETRGTWRMENDLMGGPFLSYAIYVPEQRRLYLMELGQFAPRYNKRRFVRQFEAIAYTFETDSTFVPSP